MKFSLIKARNFAGCVVLAALTACGGGGSSNNNNNTTDAVLRWNTILTEAGGVDHTPAAAGSGRTAFEQGGPTRQSRAAAIVQIAVGDAVARISGEFAPYLAGEAAPAGASIDAAVAQAAHDTLVEVYPSQQATFDAALAEDLAAIAGGQAKTDGVTVGADAADAILDARLLDGSELNFSSVPSGYVPGDEPGDWRPDPRMPDSGALTPLWGQVMPFGMTSSGQFRSPTFPALTSAEYTEAYNEVKRLGGDGVITPTERTEEQTIIGIYWGYDGQPGLGTPVGLYNEIARQIAGDQGNTVVQNARLFALLNLGLADAGCASWEAKYVYNIWRPINAIRESDGGGPTGRGDGNPDTVGDPNWTPLGAPADNGNTPNFTPPFPAYTSGHATFGGATFQTLRRFYGTDDISFTFVSKEFNGETADQNGEVRPLIPRSFSNLTDPEAENAQSRIYLGIHWSFDATEGIIMGNKVANFAVDNFYGLQASAQ